MSELKPASGGIVRKRVSFGLRPKKLPQRAPAARYAPPAEPTPQQPAEQPTEQPNQGAPAPGAFFNDSLSRLAPPAAPKNNPKLKPADVGIPAFGPLPDDAPAYPATSDLPPASSFADPTAMYATAQTAGVLNAPVSELKRRLFGLTRVQLYGTIAAVAIIDVVLAFLFIAN